MIRVMLIFLLISVVIWLALHQCTQALRPARPPLVITPSASFPAEKNALLGQSMARILPHCPGFKKLGDVLEFTDLTEEDGTVTLYFTAPDSQRIPAEWDARGQQCMLRVEHNAFSMDTRAGCQALCLGEPGIEGRVQRRELGGKAR